MDLRQLEYVIAIAETRSFTRAAARCAVAQPALSQQVRRLERELGVQLFTRTTRSVTLTDAGHVLLRNARRVVETVASARAEIDAITGLVRGRLTLGAIQYVPRLDLPAMLAAFHALHPGVDVVLRSADNAQMLAAVRGGDLDLAFVSFRPSDPPGDLNRLDLLTEPLLVVVANDHHLANRSVLHLRCLSTEPFIELGPGSGLRSQSDHAFTVAGLTRHVALEVAGLDDALSLAALGMGVVLLPQTLLEARADRRVRAIPLEAPSVERSVALVWHDTEPASPAGRVFLTQVSATLQGHLQR
ncbi:MAG: LysR substrate-binding domain-containing protein [Chloroflexota bacterium]